MGSYTAPAYSTLDEKAIQDNTTPNGDILLGPHRCLYFEAVGIISALYDGTLDLEVQLTDLSWFAFTMGSVGSVWTRSITPEFTQFTQQHQLFRYPYNVRVKATAQPSVGVATAYLITYPPPANPLF